MKRYKKYLLLIPAILYFLVGVYSLNKIGIGWDTSVNLVKGEQVFNFLQTLNPGYLIDGAHKSLYFHEIPGIQNGHPPAYSFIAFSIGHLFSEIFGFKYYYFHISNLLLGVIFIYVVTKHLFFKISKNYYVSIVSSLILISIPYYFVYSISNTKDFPVLALSTFALLVVLNKFKNIYLQIIALSIFTLLALYTKFTVVFLLPLIFFEAYRSNDIKKYIISNIKKVLITEFFIFYTVTFYFWPHLLFNFIYEVSRLYYVYFLLPAKSLNYVSFGYFYSTQTPLLYLLLFFISLIFVLIKGSSYKTLFLIWVLPSVFYLAFINRQYDVVRQFLFLWLPFVFCIFIFIKKIKKMLLLYLIIFVVSIYSFYLILIPPYKKVVYSNSITRGYVNDGWGLTLPKVLEYVKEYNTKGKRIYFSPAAFLLEYYNLKDYEIIYDPYFADIFITTTKTSSYEEEKVLREKYFKKDTKFNVFGDTLEIWLKK